MSWNQLYLESTDCPVKVRPSLYDLFTYHREITKNERGSQNMGERARLRES